MGPGWADSLPGRLAWSADRQTGAPLRATQRTREKPGPPVRPLHTSLPLKGGVGKSRAQPADFPVGGHGCSASRDGAALLPDESGNPDKPIGTYQKEAMHAPCNILATPFHRRLQGLFSWGAACSPSPGPSNHSPPLKRNRQGAAEPVGGDRRSASRGGAALLPDGGENPTATTRAPLTVHGRYGPPIRKSFIL